MIPQSLSRSQSIRGRSKIKFGTSQNIRGLVTSLFLKKGRSKISSGVVPKVSGVEIPKTGRSKIWIILGRPKMLGRPKIWDVPKFGTSQNVGIGGRSKIRFGTSQSIRGRSKIRFGTSQSIRGRSKRFAGLCRGKKLITSIYPFVVRGNETNHRFLLRENI